MTAESGGLISSSLAIPESLGGSHRTSLCSSWWQTLEPLQMSAGWYSSVDPRVFQEKRLLSSHCFQTWTVGLPESQLSLQLIEVHSD